jgi:hypothetical protein
MKTSKYSDGQILKILNQAKGGIPELCRKHRKEMFCLLSSYYPSQKTACCGKLSKVVNLCSVKPITCEL